NCVVLLRFDIGLHELRRDNADLVPHRQKLARQPLRARTRLHADESAPGALEEGEHGIASELYTLDNRAAVVEADNVKYVLAEIDAVGSGPPGSVADHGRFLLSFWSLRVRSEGGAGH